jgi:hypothetical protein
MSTSTLQANPTVSAQSAVPPLFILMYGHIDRGLSFRGPFPTFEDADIIFDAPYDWWILKIQNPMRASGQHLIMRGTLATGLSAEGPFLSVQEAEAQLSRSDLAGLVVTLESPESESRLPI